MEGFDPKMSFGDETSRRYDALETRGDEPETVAFLARLAGGRDALEFAIGTGRIALPLARAGVPVEGIEQSQEMVDRMREKPGAANVRVVIGDIAHASMGNTYGLVYRVDNTIGNLLSLDDQVRCFENAVRHLSDDGVLVVECRVPTGPTRPDRQFVNAGRVAADLVTLDTGRYDPITEIVGENPVRVSAGCIALDLISLWLAHPPEFELMVRLAGRRLCDRAGGWDNEPFTAASRSQISTDERATARSTREPAMAPTGWSALHGYASLRNTAIGSPWPERQDTLQRIVYGLARITEPRMVSVRREQPA